MTQFLGIYREPVCSPGRHRENDAAILELVAGELEARGHRVALAAAEDAARIGRDAPLVFSMSRSPAVLDLLERWAGKGRTVVNSPAAVLATARGRLASRTLGAVALPSAHVVPTARALREQIGPHLEPSAHPGDWWVKGGDLYASRREDVQRVATMQALEAALDDFERRGVSTAVLQEHVPGREIKFYAVGSTDFFHWQETIGGAASRPASAKASAVGRPPSHKASGARRSFSEGASFSEGGSATREGGARPVMDDTVFRHQATAAGTALELEIFGGDIVIGDDGRVTLIDLNDWPSFAPCRETAARAIARHLEARVIATSAAAPHAGSVSPSASA